MPMAPDAFTTPVLLFAATQVAAALLLLLTGRMRAGALLLPLSLATAIASARSWGMGVVAWIGLAVSLQLLLVVLLPAMIPSLRRQPAP